MNVKLLYNTPLWVCSKAIRKCWSSEDKSDTVFHNNEAYVKDDDGQMFLCEAGEKDKALIDRVGNKNKHSSTLEHLNYSFDIDGISRACLQELARHRHASLSVKSSRYTLKELKEANSMSFSSPQDFKAAWEIAKKFLIDVGIVEVNSTNTLQLAQLQSILRKGVSNDSAKYLLPESYKTSLVWTINARSLQNFISLRSDKAALWEIQDLAKAVFNAIPEEHKYLFKHCMKEYK